MIDSKIIVEEERKKRLVERVKEERWQTGVSLLLEEIFAIQVYQETQNHNSTELANRVTELSKHVDLRFKRIYMALAVLGAEILIVGREDVISNLLSWLHLWFP